MNLDFGVDNGAFAAALVKRVASLSERKCASSKVAIPNRPLVILRAFIVIAADRGRCLVPAV
ncbi:hypothetical protein N9C22_00595 [Paracoccaceae bacterium]|nr:hypothetical protein [Paracoccaceae bacterium]